MSVLPIAAPLRSGPSVSSLETISAMAELASTMGSTIHVVVPREPGVVEYTRALASSLGIGVSVDLMPATIRVQLQPR